MFREKETELEFEERHLVLIAATDTYQYLYQRQS